MSQTPKPKRRRDPFALGVRFACGALVGTFLAVVFVWDGMTLVGAITSIAIVATLCGVLVAWLGDKAWRLILFWFR